MRPSSPLAMLVRCVQVAKNGGPEVLTVTDFPMETLKLSPGQALIRNSYAGINYIDTYYRTGLYQKPLPYIAGDEGCGAVVAVGEGVSKDLLGKRMAFFRSKGAYASFVVTNAGDLFEVPTQVPDADAAAVMLQGCTAHYLVNDCYKVKAGDKVLVHAAAGGTGLLISQLCKKAGATVLGTVGSDEKAKLAQSIGRVDHAINYSAGDWTQTVKELVGSVDVVYDGVGKAVFEKSLGVLRRRGHMITFGNASGPVDPIAPLMLTRYGSLTLQRPTLADYSAPGEINQRVSEIFASIADGSLKVHIGKIFKLDQAAEAHAYLEAKSSTGKILLNCQE
jgi:NADPH2:quinone reductase